MVAVFPSTVNGVVIAVPALVWYLAFASWNV